MSDRLRVEHLSRSFGGIQALDAVSLRVPSGHITALIGPNGAGKTTLFNCITGFYPASTGRIAFEGRHGLIDVAELLGHGSWRHPLRKLYYSMFGGSHHAARQGLVRTFQNIRLFPGLTVMENCLVALREKTHPSLLAGLLNTRSFQRRGKEAIETAFQWLDEFGLGDAVNRLAGELSYGQQRRLEMARALCLSPTLLCLDEPAAGLNAQETHRLSEEILRIRDHFGVTVFLIEHDMSMVMRISDQVYVLDQGRLIAEGTPDDVRQNPVVIEAYLG